MVRISFIYPNKFVNDDSIHSSEADFVCLSGTPDVDAGPWVTPLKNRKLPEKFVALDVTTLSNSINKVSLIHDADVLFDFEYSKFVINSCLVFLPDI